MSDDFARLGKRGFLPIQDPLIRFPEDSPYEILDRVGSTLPARLREKDFRPFIRGLEIPFWNGEQGGNHEGGGSAGDEGGQTRALRLYYVRLGFLASAYINQVDAPPIGLLPANLARPLVAACKILDRPPLLSYDGYALYNWRRLDPAGPIALGNIDTFQNFVELYDEHWFILVHVEIEAIGASILRTILELETALERDTHLERDTFLKREKSDRTDRNHESGWEQGRLESALAIIGDSLEKQIKVLERIPEQMSPELYFKSFRPYIRFFENVVYEGVDTAPVHYRGETGAQSSILPTLTAFLKIPHNPSILTDHLRDMRNYMPAEHRRFLERVERLPSVRERVGPENFNRVLEALAKFREVHFSWATEYIAQHVSDPRGTGGTPFMKWLQQLIDETRAFQK